MSESITITLPLPHKHLSPNARVHWRAKAKATKAYREQSFLDTLSAISSQETVKHDAEWLYATSQATFYHAQTRRRDKDNLLSSLKAAMDGITDSRLIDDDVGITHLPVVCEIDRENPRVEITITKIGA